LELWGVKAAEKNYITLKEESVFIPERDSGVKG
jgi:hypothetical protein